jgi:hypothetical protein
LLSAIADSPGQTRTPPFEENMSVIPTNPVTNIHSLATQPTAPRPVGTQVATPQSAAPVKNPDNDTDTGGVDLIA